MPALCFSILTSLFLPPSSVSLSYFILAVPIRKCLGKHSCTSSPFPIAILNGTSFFRSVKAMNNWNRSAIKQILLLVFFCILFYSCCSHARVFVGKTLLQEFPISYSNTELYLLFSLGEIVLALAEASPIKIWSSHYFRYSRKSACFLQSLRCNSFLPMLVMFRIILLRGQHLV